MHYRIYLFIYFGWPISASKLVEQHQTTTQGVMLSTPFKEGIGFYQSPANQHWEDTGDEAYHSLSLSKKDKNVCTYIKTLKVGPVKGWTVDLLLYNMN